MGKRVLIGKMSEKIERVVIKLEESSQEEWERVIKDVTQKLMPPVVDWQAAEWREVLLRNSTIQAITDFRTKAKTSYREGRFGVPEYLKFFVQRDPASEIGGELRYHEERVGRIHGLLGEVRKNPLFLKRMEEFLLGFFTQNLRTPRELSREEISNAYIYFKQLEVNVADAYTLYSYEKFGDRAYLLGIDERGGLYSKAKGGGWDVLRNLHFYHRTHAHAVTFMNLDPTVLRKIVPDMVWWANDKDRFQGLEQEEPGKIGRAALAAGINHKQYYSPLPHEFIIRSGKIGRISVIDVPEIRGVYFCTRFMDDTVSVGVMTTPNEEGYSLLHTSDLIARLIMDDRATTSDTHILFDLVGCMARDIFVELEKETRKIVYQESIVKANPKKRVPTSKVILLPRYSVNATRVREQEGMDDIQRDRYLSERMVRLSPSFVPGHKMMLPEGKKPDPEKVKLGRFLGIFIPEGATYVRDHFRGINANENYSRAYRSRSALEEFFRRK